MGMAENDLPGSMALHEGESAKATIARIHSLPTDRYPHLIEVATAAMRSDVSRGQSSGHFTPGAATAFFGIAEPRAASPERCP